MARPRVFVSSTYYDLRTIRSELREFIDLLGYVGVLFEQGDVPHAAGESLEDGCREEVLACDMLVAVLGGSIGTGSKTPGGSLTWEEIAAAHQHGKHIHGFVEKRVLYAYQAFVDNGRRSDFRSNAVSDPGVFRLLEQWETTLLLPPLHPFEVARDIADHLRAQWAGLLCRLLRQADRQREREQIRSLAAVADTLQGLISGGGVTDILLASHPAFAAVRQAARIPYRVSFRSIEELDVLLSARKFALRTDSARDWLVWENPHLDLGMRVRRALFDARGVLTACMPDDFDDRWVQVIAVDGPSRSRRVGKRPWDANA